MDRWIIHFVFYLRFSKNIYLFYSTEGTYTVYLIGMIASLILLIYIISIMKIVRYMLRRWGLSMKHFQVGMLVGGFIVAPLCIELNNGLSLLWSRILSPETQELWDSFLTGPWTEELFKALFALGLVYLLGGNTLKKYMMMGIAVGFGFQILEDISFIIPVEANAEALNYAFPSAFDRIGTFISSHFIYTAIARTGIYYWQ